MLRELVALSIYLERPGIDLDRYLRVFGYPLDFPISAADPRDAVAYTEGGYGTRALSRVTLR